MKKSLKLMHKDFENLFAILKNGNASQALSKSDQEELLDKVSNSYVSGIATSAFVKKRVDNNEIMELLIYILSIITGYPENQINGNTKLDDIGLTAMKREILRRKLNLFLKENGKPIISGSEMNKCKTVDDVFSLIKSKLS